MSPKALLRDLQREPWEDTEMDTLEMLTEIIKPQQIHEGGSGPMWTPSGFPGDPQSVLRVLHRARDIFRECIMSSILESQNFRPQTSLCA